MSIDAILFDLDGTLIDSAQVIASVINEMRSEQCLTPVDVSLFRKWVSLGADELLRRGMDRPGEDASELVREFRDRYRALPTPLDSLYPGVGETLATLARSGVPMAICSNKPESLCRKILDDTGMTALFGAIVGGDTVRQPKPSREPLDHALALIGSSVTGAIMVGDSTVDQKAARACGLPFVFFSGGYDDGVDVADAFARIDAIGHVLPIVASASLHVGREPDVPTPT